MAKRGKKKPVARVSAKTSPPARQAGGLPVEAEIRRGFAAFQRAAYGEAVQAWRRVHRAAPSPARTGALAEALFRRALRVTDPARGVQDLQEAVALAPERPVYHFHLGLACERLGQRRRALAALEAAHRLAPDDGRITRHLALLLVADPTTAERAGDLVSGGRGADELAAAVRALASLRAGDPMAAVELLGRHPRPAPLTNLALGLVQLAAGDAESAVETMARARRSRQQGTAEMAEAASLGLLEARLRAGDLPGALDELRRAAVPSNPGLRRASAVAARKLGMALALDERLDEAALSLARALELEPQNGALRRGLAHLHEVLAARAPRSAGLAEAAEHWKAALALEPENGRVIHNLALACERLERWEEAGAYWDQVVRLWRKEAPPEGTGTGPLDRRLRLRIACAHLATVQEAAGDLDAAARTLDRAIHFDAEDIDLRLNAAALHMEIGDYSSAVNHFRRALTARPDDLRVLVDLGSAYTLLGDHRQAFSVLQDARARFPADPTLAVALAGTHHSNGHAKQRVGRWEEAASEFHNAAVLVPDDPEHMKCLGGVYLRLGRTEHARTVFHRALALSPDDPRVMVDIGAEYLEHGRDKEADALFRKAVHLDGGPVIRAAVGLIYLAHDGIEAALRYLKPLLKTREPLLMRLIGKTLLDRNRETAAVPFLERAVALDPSNTRARMDLGWAYTWGPRDRERALAQLARAEALAREEGDRATVAEVADARRALALMAQEEPAARNLTLSRV